MGGPAPTVRSHVGPAGSSCPYVRQEFAAWLASP